MSFIYRLKHSKLRELNITTNKTQVINQLKTIYQHIHYFSTVSINVISKTPPKLKIHVSILAN